MNGLKRVLFVCVGNACRSQMAEAFARLYGSDVIVPASAGFSPAMHVAEDTLRCMAEKNADLRDHFPKPLKQMERASFDMVINMSGRLLPESMQWPERSWHVADPIGMDYDGHCDVRDRIETMVMELIVELRREQQKPWLDRKPGPQAPPSR